MAKSKATKNKAEIPVELQGIQKAAAEKRKALKGDEGTSALQKQVAAYKQASTKKSSAKAASKEGATATKKAATKKAAPKKAAVKKEAPKKEETKSPEQSIIETQKAAQEASQQTIDQLNKAKDNG